VKILVVTPYFPPGFRAGGGVRSIRNAALGLARAGASVDVVTTDSHVEGNVEPRRVEHGLRIQTFSLRGTATLRRHAYAPAVGRAVRNALCDIDVCVLEGVWSYPLAVASRQCRRARVPYVICARGTLEALSLSEKSLKKGVYRAVVVNRAIDGAAAVLFASRQEHHNSRAALGHTRALVLPNALEPQEPIAPQRTSLRERLEVPDDALLIGMSGRIHPRKGFHVILPVLARCDRRMHLVAFGSDDEGHLDGIGRLAESCGVRERFHATGYLEGEELQQTYSEIDLLVLPSVGESFGNVVLEALARETEVLVSERVPLGEYVERNRLGAVVQHLEPGAWADALGRWIERRADFDGPRAARLVREDFDLDSIGRRLLEQLRGCRQSVESAADS